MARASFPGFVACALACAVPSGCFDTTLIPAEPAVEGGAPSAAGGTSADAGDVAAEAGAEHGAASPGGAGGVGGVGGAAAAGTPSAGSAGSAGKPNGGEPSVTWLALQGSEASASEEPNGDLLIAGQFYAYADDCAELNWDETSRCATGRLCAPLGGVNWGVAVGFDFKTTGVEGAPSSRKLTWDPREVGAIGVAFEIGGEMRAPGLQLWVLNMDPIWDGECSAMTCEIAGPPDGRRLLPLAGQLLFNDMDKDDWGGGGVYYEYDPAAVHALQFKLPAIEVGAVSFSFCVDALGIVR